MLKLDTDRSVMATRSKHQGRNIRYMPLARAVALFFLLFTVADILLPQYFCREEWQALPAVSTAPVRNNVAGQENTTPPDAPRPDAPVRYEEDCFCCCAHVLLPATLAVTSFLNASRPFLAITLPEASLPTAPHQTIYHPPRLA